MWRERNRVPGLCEEDVVEDSQDCSLVLLSYGCREACCDYRLGVEKVTHKIPDRDGEGQPGIAETNILLHHPSTPLGHLTSPEKMSQSN